MSEFDNERILDDAILYAVDVLKLQFPLKVFQKDIVRSVINNHFSVSNAKTGSGKSISYLVLPFIFKYLRANNFLGDLSNKCCVIIYPFLALISDQLHIMSSVYVMVLMLSTSKGVYRLLSLGTRRLMTYGIIMQFKKTQKMI